MLSVSGFNGFRQISTLLTIISKDTDENERNAISHLNSITTFHNNTISNRCFKNIGSQIIFSWSYCAVYYGKVLSLSYIKILVDVQIKCIA